MSRATFPTISLSDQPLCHLSLSPRADCDGVGHGIKRVNPIHFPEPDQYIVKLNLNSPRKAQSPAVTALAKALTSPEACTTQVCSIRR